MTTKKKTVLIVIIVLVLLIGIEAISFLIFKNSVQRNDLGYKRTKIYNIENYDWFFRDYTGTNARKRPIFCVGNAYMSGEGINGDKTLPALISKISGRTVHERAIPGTSATSILEEFQSGRYKEIAPNAEYFIYIYYSSQLGSLYQYQIDYSESELNVRYKLNNEDNLVRIKNPKFPMLNSLFFVKNIQKTWSDFISRNEYNDFTLFTKVMRAIMKEKKAQFPDAKFVVIYYPEIDNVNTDSQPFEPEIIRKLKRIGFIVINAEDLTDLPICEQKYINEEFGSPTDTVWESISPALAKKLNL